MEGLGSVLQDVTIDVDISEKKLDVNKIKLFKYFDGYLPTYLTFNNRFILAKAKKSDGNANEVMMLFDRTSDSEYLSYGIQPEDYYNSWKEGMKSTPCTPMVAKING